MRDELLNSLWRYDAMTGLVDWTNEDDPGREDRDRDAFGKEYGLVRYPDGRDYVCNGESSASSSRSAATPTRRPWRPRSSIYRGSRMPTVRRLTSKPMPRPIKTGAPNIIEALFSLKVDRLVSEGDPAAVDFSWRVTRALMVIQRPDRNFRDPHLSLRRDRTSTRRWWRSLTVPDSIRHRLATSPYGPASRSRILRVSSGLPRLWQNRLRNEPLFSNLTCLLSLLISNGASDGT